MVTKQNTKPHRQQKTTSGYRLENGHSGSTALFMSMRRSLTPTCLSLAAESHVALTSGGRILRFRLKLSLLICAIRQESLAPQWLSPKTLLLNAAAIYLSVKHKNNKSSL